MGTAISLSAKAGMPFFPPFVHRLSPAVGLSPFCAPAGGILQADGKLLYKGKITDMHSCAAKVKGVKAKRLNGFAVWFVKRDGILVSIQEIREDYRTWLQQKTDSNK